jgi:general secretion pathway protein A
MHYDWAQVDEYVSRHLEYAGVDQPFFSNGALERNSSVFWGNPNNY